MTTWTTRFKRRDQDERGFTLIELLVVVVIIGILIGIAVPVYLNYRKSANDKAAQSDLRAAISALEGCQASNGTYPATLAACTTQTFTTSDGTTLAYYPISATDLNGYILGATNSKGSGKNYCYNSTKGGSVTSTSTAVSAYRANC